MKVIAACLIALQRCYIDMTPTKYCAKTRIVRARPTSTLAVRRLVIAIHTSVQRATSTRRVGKTSIAQAGYVPIPTEIFVVNHKVLVMALNRQVAMS
jgi:hypothetical protein